MSEEQAFAKASAVNENHKKLGVFEGTFRAEVKLWMGPGEPQKSTGTMVSTFDLGGRFLKQTYTGDPNEGPFPAFEGRGWWGFNNVSGKYEGLWIDNASTVMQTEMGEVDESSKVWTMIGEMTNPQDGKSMTKRTVITVDSPDQHRMEMFFTNAEGQEFKGMEILYRRV